MEKAFILQMTTIPFKYSCYKGHNGHLKFKSKKNKTSLTGQAICFSLFSNRPRILGHGV